MIPWIRRLASIIFMLLEFESFISLCNAFRNRKNEVYYDRFSSSFEKDVITYFVRDISFRDNSSNNKVFTMFKSMIIHNNVSYYCERYFVNRSYTERGNRLGLSNSKHKTIKFVGMQVEAEDPRLVLIRNTIYIIFHGLEETGGGGGGVYVSPYHSFSPIRLKAPFKALKQEKNWAPFVMKDELHFVYSFDPLVIIKWMGNNNGSCIIIYEQPITTYPIRTAKSVFRGGSNLIHYENNIYLGGIHSRIKFPNLDLIHFTHLVMIDMNQFKIIYVSKPIKFEYNNKYFNNNNNNNNNKLKSIHNILIDQTPERNHHHIIQDPISFGRINEYKYWITINVRNEVTLLYNLYWNTNQIIARSNVSSNYSIGYWNSFIKQSNIQLFKSYINYINNISF